MLYPTINKLTKGKFNRYQLAVATAKCARIITDEYVRERHDAERAAAVSKESDKTVEMMVNPDYRDRKAVKIAIDKIEKGDYVIVDRDEDGSMTTGNTAAHAANTGMVITRHEPSGATVAPENDEDDDEYYEEDEEDDKDKDEN